MSLQTRLSALITAVGADIKSLSTRVSTIEAGAPLRLMRGKSEDSLRIIRGSVGLDGSIALGSGFSVVKNATGSWTVTYSSDFTSTPTVVVSAQPGGNNMWVTLNNGKANNAHTFSVQGWGLTAGTLVDTNWSFIAVGPA